MENKSEIWASEENVVCVNDVFRTKKLDVNEIETLEDVKKILDLLQIEASASIVKEKNLEKYFKLGGNQ